MTVALILDKLKSLPKQEYLDYIAKHNKGPLTDIQVLEMFEDEQSSINGSDVVTGLANDIIHHVEPKNWIGKPFGNWIATGVIHDTNKSIILKGEPLDNSHKQMVAIKILSPTFQAMSNDKHQAMQAHYMEKLKCPNMVEMKSAGTTEDGTNYIVMEYLNNDNIVAYCQRRGLPLYQRLKLLISVCDGVIHMHQHMVVHADLKPGNILVDNNKTPKIIDLDLSLALDNNFNDEFSFQNIKGHTNNYAAPEQIKGNSATALSDIYSLGLVLKEMLLLNIKTELNLNTLKGIYPQENRFAEIIAIIDKCCEEDPNKRYESVSHLKQDIQVYLDAKDIVVAYKQSTNLPYRIYRYIFGRKILFSTVATFCLVIGFGINSIVTERNEANEALTLMAQMFDPRELDEKLKFEKMANELLNDNAYFDQNDFDKLISFGDGYYGNGKGDKAIIFFQKAKDIYPTINTPQNIIARTKLALAYFLTFNHKGADEQFEDYREILFTDKLESPELIQMFFAFVEINSRIRHILENTKRPTLSVLADIDLDSYTDEKDKALTELQIEYYLGIEKFYSSTLGDYASNSASQSEEELRTITDPLSREAKLHFTNALAILKKHKLKTHYEPLIYSWLSRMQAELQQFELSIAYNDIALQKTIQLYGESHPQTIDVYLRRAVITRFYRPDIGLSAALKVHELLKTTYAKGVFNSFFNQVLAEAYFNVGDFKNGLKLAHYAVNYYKNDHESIDVYTNVPLLNMLTFVSELHPIFKGDFKNILSTEATLEKIFLREMNLDNEFIEHNPFVVVDKLYGMNVKTQSNTIIKMLDETLQNLNESMSYEEQSISSSIKMGEVCIRVPSCQPAKFIKDVDIENKYHQNEKNFSPAYIVVSIRHAFILFHLKDYKKTITILENLMTKTSFTLFPDAYFVWLTKSILYQAMFLDNQGSEYEFLAIEAKDKLNTLIGPDFTFELTVEK